MSWNVRNGYNDESSFLEGDQKVAGVLGVMILDHTDTSDWLQQIDTVELPQPTHTHTQTHTHTHIHTHTENKDCVSHSATAANRHTIHNTIPLSICTCILSLKHNKHTSPVICVM